MRLLSLALEGLWWRRATSVMLLVVAACTAAAAAAAPSYAASASDAVLRAAVARAPTGGDGTGIEVLALQSGAVSTSALESAVHDAFTGAAGTAYPRAVLQLSAVQRPAVQRPGGVQRIALDSRSGLCGELRVLEGSCVSETDRTGVVVERAVARALHLAVGAKVAVAPFRGGRPIPLHVRGIAVRRDAAAPYWFGSTPDVGQVTLAAWTPASYFSAFRVEPVDGVTASAELALDRSVVHVDTAGPMLKAVGAAVRRLQDGGATSRPDVTSALERVVQSGTAAGSRLMLPIVVVIAELLALGWYLLHALVSGSVEGRGAEVALSKVRGMSASGTLVLVLLEPALLLGAAIPLGVLLAAAGERWLAPAVLGAGVDIRIGWLSWAAALVAAAGGLIAAAAASAAVLRRPVLEQWRRTSRAGSRRSAVVEIVLVALAAAGITQLELSGSLAAGSGGGIAILAPMLLIVAGALVASRLVVLLARLGFGPTRGTGAVSAFVGLRQLARRPAGRRTFGVLVVAVAMAAYGVSSAAVLAQNRDERALTDVGAATVLHIAPDPRTDARIRSVDPTGRALTGVAQADIGLASDYSGFGTAPSANGSPSVLVVDPRTFGAVAYWRDDFGSATLPALLKPLSAAAPRIAVITGTRMTLSITTPHDPGLLGLAADLTDIRGAPITARLGVLKRGTEDYTADVKGCAGGCRLRRIYLTRPIDQIGALVIDFTIRSVHVTGAGSSAQPTLDGIGWSPLNPTPVGSITAAEKVTAEPDGLRIAVSVVGAPSETAPGFGVVAGTGPHPPALVAAHLTGGSSDATVQTPDGDAFQVQRHGVVEVLPRAGDAGVVLARDWVEAASPSGYSHLLENQIWVGRDAPSGIVDRLRAAGVRVLSVETAADRASTLASTGPAFATPFTVAGGAAAVLLAVAAVVLGITLLARRRVFELSAMRALGIRTRSLRGSLLVEQGALIVTATVFGLVLAVAGVQLALPALPAYVDDPAYPAFLVHQPLGTLVGVGAAIAALLLVAVAATAVVLERRTSVGALREAEQ
ncbi:ABC transporter permease [Amnibacterium sp. CER49]|uniref:ABC transporter permease n=1 Tax=Amnibacterium sp. CER49 TaxID=3039161 RepID=UPI0024478A8A|nr:ABC transporter permease [Amnibacterium sp. CER49]MDH2444068.1 ABC transporter permease [Amnibacterium sp. CER49]